MGMKELVEQHPIRQFVSVAVTTCTVTAGIVGFLMNKKAEIDSARLESTVTAVENEKRLSEERHRSEVDWLNRRHADDAQKQALELESVQKQVATVQRTIGSTSDALDVRQMLVSGRQAGQRFSGAAYFADERFYTKPLKEGDGWSHAVTTELAMLASTLETSADDIRARLPPESAQLLEAIPLHVWRHKEEFRVEQGETRMRISPMVIVQHLPAGEMERLMRVATGSDQASPETGELEDKTGAMLTQFLLIEAQTREPGKTRTNIGELHKVGDVVYTHIETILQDVVVNGVRNDEFLLIKEMLIIGTGGDLYVVKTVIPTPPDFSSPAIAWIGDWLMNFGIRTRDGGMFDVQRTADRRGRG